MELYYDGAQGFFRTLRDVNRFLSSFGFHIGVFRSGSSFEVNLIDLFGLEVLRVFQPSVYHALPSLRHILTNEPRLMRRHEREHDKTVLDDLLRSVPTQMGLTVQHILEAIFPPASEVLAGSHHQHGGDHWARELRACSYKVFDRYFQFAVSLGDVSQAEIDGLIEVSTDRAALSERFKRFKGDGRLSTLLERLDDNRNQIPEDAANAVVPALFDLNIEHREELLNEQMFVQRIVDWCLRQQPDQSTRKQILREAMESATGLVSCVIAVEWLGGAANELQSSGATAVLESQEDIGDLREQAVGLIRRSAESGRLIAEREFPYLMSIWADWSGVNEPREWVDALIKRPGGLLAYLRGMRRVQRTLRYGAPQQYTYFYTLSQFERFGALETLTSRIGDLEPSTLSSEDAENLRLFQEAIARRTEGKPDFEIPLDP